MKKTILFILLILVSSDTLYSQDFVTTWKTDNTDIDTSNETSITIPTFPGETYLYDVDWDNDGTFDDIGVTGNITHDYGVISTPTVSIRGVFPRIYFNNAGDRIKIQSVEQWGTQQWTSMESAFYGCTDLVINVTDTNPPNLTEVTDMSHMFHGAKSVNSSFNTWNTSNVEDMSYMFSGTSAFNQNIYDWDTSNVINMNGMFQEALAFNQDISNWNTIDVNHMLDMFREALVFNQDISSWDTGNVTIMAGMFQEASAFNQDLGNWVTINVSNMARMFNGASSFNQDISSWNTGNVNNMAVMFQDATVFNQDLGNWDVSNVIIMSNMFNGVTLSITNYDNILIGWDTQNLQDSVSFHGGNSTYCNGETARNNMVTSNNWTITDGGLDCSSTHFVSRWKTDNPGTSIPGSIIIDTFPGETYLYDVDWDNDGVFDELGITGDVFHDYDGGASVFQTIRIRGAFPRIYFNDGGDKEKIVGITNWGNIAWTSMESAFYGCTNLQITATDAPDLSNVTSMSRMFQDASSVNQDFNNWNTSNVTNMSYMFDGASSFNQTISDWDTSIVTDMFSMFREAIAFNQNISSWDTGDVITMGGMFAGATVFNEDISNWDTSSVNGMQSMFLSALAFNQTINDWDTSNVTNMFSMFRNASAFNQDLGNWDVSNVTNMLDMFLNVTLSTTNYDNMLTQWNAQALQNNVSFHGGNSVYCNGEAARNNMISTNNWVITDGGLDCDSLTYFITVWETDDIETTITIPTFPGEAYNYDVDWDNDGVWDDFGITGDITHDYGVAGIHTVIIRDVFPRIYFNNSGDKEKIVSVNQWGTQNWTSMESAFHGCSSLNINASDVPNFSNMSNMSRMLQRVNAIDSDISVWNTSTITNMSSLFFSVFTFNQDINTWNTSNVTDMSGMFRNAEDFNQVISNWDTGSVTNMESMFNNALSFNQNIGNWDVRNVTNMTDMFLGVTLSTENYDSLLTLWDAQNLQNGVIFNGGNSTYCNAQTARSNIITIDGWMIIDGGLDCSALSINENVFDSLNIYPNPVQNTLFIDGLNKDAKIEILDVTGKVIILTDAIDTLNEIDVSKLKSAFYFIRLITANKIAVKKFIKK